jgi:hypothetical protein
MINKILRFGSRLRYRIPKRYFCNQNNNPNDPEKKSTKKKTSNFKMNKFINKNKSTLAILKLNTKT